MFKIRLYIIIFIGFFSVTITAQEKLNEYLTIAANNNPGLKMAFNQYMAALEKAPQVSSLPDPLKPEWGLRNSNSQRHKCFHGLAL